MGLSSKFRQAGGGFVPGVVQATQEASSEELANKGFLSLAEQRFGENAQSIGLDNTVDFDQ